MKYRFLGSSGLLVSRLSLGTMTFGTDNWGCGEKESHDILKAFIDAGGNFIDCANVYAGGRSEEIIGYFLPQVERDDLVIASKCYFPMGQKPNQYGLSRKHVMASCEASLKRLRTDYIDIYYIHGPDPVTPYEETLRALEEAILAFPGAALVISHDRWFLDRIATHILAFEGDSQVRFFQGNVSDYEAFRHKELGTAADQPHRIRYKRLTRS